MMQPENGRYFGRLFSYPQGIASFFPTILTLAAVIANFWPLFGGHDRPVFICQQWQESSYYSDTYSDKEYGCLQLFVTNPAYWDESEDDMEKAPVQAAAVMIVFSFLAGAIAFFQLLSASCFELPAKKLLIVAITQLLCALFTFVSIFVVLIYDPCKDIDYCERVKLAGLRMEEGAVAALFSAMFYCWAAWTVLKFRNNVQQHEPRATSSGNGVNSHNTNKRTAEEARRLVDEETVGSDHIAPAQSRGNTLLSA